MKAPQSLTGGYLSGDTNLITQKVVVLNNLFQLAQLFPNFRN